MTFETLFKAWTVQITDHIKDIKEDQHKANEAVVKSTEAMSGRINDVDEKIEKLSKDFLVHVTTEKVRFATISAIIGLLATAISVAISVIKFGKDDGDKPKTEITIGK